MICGIFIASERTGGTMLRGIYQNSSSMLLLESRVDNTANNLANANTPGYKKRDVFFQQLIVAEQSVERNNIDVTLPGGKVATYIDASNGIMNKTGNPLDMAISGKGYFAVETPQGIAYTRDGRFSINDTGQLVNQNGYLVIGDGGPIEIQGNSLEISKTGDIIVDGNVVNRLTVRDFDANAAKMFDNFFVPDEEISQPELSEYAVVQGFIEESNVNPVKEMAELIVAQRHFEMNYKLIRAQDDTLDKAVNQVGK